MVENIDKLKEEYNYVLDRCYKGEKYIIEHKDTYDMYSSAIIELTNKLSSLLDEIRKDEIVTNEQAVKGF